MSIILFSSTIWRFHPRFFFSSKSSDEKLHNLLPFYSQIIFWGQFGTIKPKKKALLHTMSQVPLNSQTSDW